MDAVEAYRQRRQARLDAKVEQRRKAIQAYRWRKWNRMDARGVPLDKMFAAMRRNDADEPKDWTTLENGVHVPIMEGQSKEEAVKGFVAKKEYDLPESHSTLDMLSKMSKDEKRMVLREAPDYEIAPNLNHQSRAQYISQMYDLNEKPQVMSDNEFEKYVNENNATVVYRAIVGDKESGLSAKDIMDYTIYGDNIYYSNGAYGSGIYTSTSTQTADYYSRKSDSEVMTIAISPSARIVNHEDLRNIPEFFYGPSEAALLSGYNVIEVNQPDENYYVFLDRSAMVIKHTNSGNGRTDADGEIKDWITMNGAAVPIKEGQTKEEAATSFIQKKEAESRSERPSVEKKNPQVISSKSSTGEIIRDGDFVYKNTTVVGLRPEPGAVGRPSHEGEVYEALEGNPNVLPGRVVDYGGEEKIETPFVEHILSTDEIPKEKRERYASIVNDNLDGIMDAVNALSNEGYNYSDPMQFAYHDDKLKLFDFSNAWKPHEGIEEAVTRNYSECSRFFTDFGLPGVADRINRGMELRDWARILDNDAVNKGVWVKGDTQEALKQLKATGVEPNNLYYSRNARFIQGSTRIGQTDELDDRGNKYIVSEKPLSQNEMDEWEIKPIYVQK